MNPGSPLPTSNPQAPVEQQSAPPAGAPTLGEGQPLPQDAATPGTAKGQAPAPGAAAKGAPAAPATAQAAAAQQTKQPTIKPFAKDTVETGATSRAQDSESTTKPFGNYDLPPSEGATGKRAGETDELHTALAFGVQDMVKELFADGTMQGIQDRAAFLAANPAEGVLTQMAGNEFGTKFASAFSEALGASNTKALMQEQFGASAVQITDAANTLISSMMLGNGLLGANIPTNKLVAELAGKYLGIDPASIKMPSFGGINETGGAAGAQGLGLLGPDGLPTKGALESIGKNIAPLLEASMEFYIASSARLVKGDTGKDIAIMTARLNQLKIEKKELISKILEKEASVMGLEMSQSAAVAEAQEAQKCSQTWSLVGCIVAVVVAIVVAVVVSIFSFGTAAPAMAVTVAAVIGCTTSVAAGLCVACAVCAIVAAVCTIVTNLPMILHGLSLLMSALGFSGAAEELESASNSIKEWYGKNAWFTWMMMGIQIACSLFMLVVMLPASTATAAQVSATLANAGMAAGGSAAAAAGAAASAAATAGGATAAAASAAGVAAAAGSVLGTVAQFNTIMTLVNLASALISCTNQIATSIITRNLARLQAEIDALSAKLAEVDVEIKKLLQQIDEKKQEEDFVKDDIQRRQDTEASIMASMQKAADSYTQMLQATSLV